MERNTYICKRKRGRSGKKITKRRQNQAMKNKLAREIDEEVEILIQQEKELNCREKVKKKEIAKRKEGRGGEK